MLTTTIADFKKLALTIYNKKDVPETILTVVGESGIGKTAACLQFVEELKGYEVKPRVINVAHLNIEDMGMPSNNEEEYIQFKMSELFKVKDENVLILLDELNRPNNEAVINFLMGAVNERRLFGIPISDKVRFMATMNPNNEHYPETQDIFADIAAERRFNQIELRYDHDQFLQYSKRQKMHDDLMSFLTQNPEQVLVPGKLNCPRQWHRFDKDILKARRWKKTDGKELKMASSLYMDNPTNQLWLKHWEGSLERFVRAVEILKDFSKVQSIVQDQLARNKIDLISATADDLRATVHSKSSLMKGQLDNIKDFLLIIPKAIAFTVIEDMVQNTKCSVTVKKYIYGESELMELIASGTST